MLPKLKLIALAAALALTAPCAAVPPTLIAHTAGGGTPNGAASNLVASDDLRWVAFTSTATDLDPDDTDAAPDVYLTDAQAGTTTRISKDPATGFTSVQGCYARAMSGDGRSIVMACNLRGFDPALIAPNDSIGILVFDRDVDDDGTFDEPGATSLTLLSRETDGSDPNFNFSDRASISADGRFVLYHNFISYPNRPECGVNTVGANIRRLWLADRDSDADGVFDEPGSVTRTCPTPIGSFEGLISGDGKVIAFETTETLDAFESVPFAWDRDVYVTVIATGTVTLASRGVNGQASDNHSYLNDISANGDAVLFTSYASNMLANPAGFTERAFLRHVAAGTTEHLTYDYDTYTHTSINVTGVGLDLTPDGSRALLRFAEANSPNLRNQVVRTGVNARSKEFVYGGENARLASDGDHTVFLSAEASYHVGDTNGVDDVFTSPDAPDIALSIDAPYTTSPINYPGQAATFIVLIENTGSTSSEASTVVMGPTSQAIVQHSSGMQNFSCSVVGSDTTCAVPVLAPGEGGWWRIDLAPTALEDVELTATATSAPHDVDASNDVANLALAVRAATDLSASVSFSPTAILVGSSTTAIIQVKNLGGMYAATNVVVLVTPPAALTWEPSSVTIDLGSSCDTSVTPFVCTIPTLGANATAEIHFTVNGTVAGPASVNANVTSDTGEVSPANNGQARSFNVVNPAPPPDPGDGGGDDAGGGGGSSDPFAALAVLAFALRRRSRPR